MRKFIILTLVTLLLVSMSLPIFAMTPQENIKVNKSRVVELQNQIQALEDRVNELYNQINRSEQTINFSKQMLELRRAEVNKYSSKLGMLNQDSELYNETKALLSNARADMNRLERLISEMQITIEDSKSEINSINSDIENLNIELKANQDNAKRLEAQIKAQSQKPPAKKEQPKAEFNLDKYRKDAIEKIKSFEYIEDEAKSMFIDEVEKADSKEGIDKIIDVATKLNDKTKSELEAKRQEALDALSKSNMSDEEKAELQDKIANSTSLDELVMIIGEILDYTEEKEEPTEEEPEEKETETVTKEVQDPDDIDELNKLIDTLGSELLQLDDDLTGVKEELNKHKQKATELETNDDKCNLVNGLNNNYKVTEDKLYDVQSALGSIKDRVESALRSINHFEKNNLVEEDVLNESKSKIEIIEDEIDVQSAELSAVEDINRDVSTAIDTINEDCKQEERQEAETNPTDETKDNEKEDTSKIKVGQGEQETESSNKKGIVLGVAGAIILIIITGVVVFLRKR